VKINKVLYHLLPIIYCLSFIPILWGFLYVNKIMDITRNDWYWFPIMISEVFIVVYILVFGLGKWLKDNIK